MNSNSEDVLHKLEFKKIVQNSPKNNNDGCLNPPSFDESFFLFNSYISNNDLKETKQQQINQHILMNCEKWIETIESPSSLNYFKTEQIRNNLSQFSIFIRILLFMKYFIDFLNIVLSLFFGLFIPILYLVEDYQNIKYILYLLISCHLVNILIQNLYIYLQIIKKKKMHNKQKFTLLNEITLKNFIFILFILIYLLENITFLLLVITFYYFYSGYNMIEIFALLLLISKREFFNILAILKVIIYYVYFLHLFSCFFENTNRDGDIFSKYKESFISNIQFFTFQSNFYVQMNYEVMINQIVALILMLFTLDVLVQIRIKDQDLKNKITFDIYVLQYFILHHKGQILRKFQVYSQISEKVIKKQKLAQQIIIRKIYKQILKDNLQILGLFSKQVVKNLSQKVQSFRTTKDQVNQEKYGLYLILKGREQLTFTSKFKSYKKDLNTNQFTFGLINCFSTYISEVQVEMNSEVLSLYINPADFYTSLTQSQDIELFHLIRNQIIFEGNTSLIGYRCWICNGFHQEKRCQHLKIDFNFTTRSEQNRSQFRKRFKKKRSKAYLTYLINNKIENLNINESESSLSDSNEQYQIYADDASGSQKVTEKNLIVSSKGNIQLPTIQKDFYSDQTDKLYEQLKSSHRNIQLQPSIYTSSQQQGENFRPDFRSIPLFPSQCKFQELQSVDDIDCVKEFVYFYPEFNISKIISLLNK